MNGARPVPWFIVKGSVMPRGRINDELRPKIDFEDIPDIASLGTVAKQRGPAKLTIGDVHPKVRAIVDAALALDAGHGIPVPMPDEPRALEFLSQCRRYGRMHTPELTVGSPPELIDNVEMQRMEWRVVVTAKVREARAKIAVNAPAPDESYQNGQATGAQTVIVGGKHRAVVK